MRDWGDGRSDDSVVSEEALMDLDGDVSSVRGMRLRVDAGVWLDVGAEVAGERPCVAGSGCGAEPRLDEGPGEGPARLFRRDGCADCNEACCADLCFPFDLLGDESRDVALLVGADDRGVVFLRPLTPLE